ncbi:flavoprotein [Phytomonospora endophytica]|uniref:Phosphopantothenoylcysteine synthetase/decarboxylase n=1 Tax=Phytomonospora endophytica TaxID=714109 RepID=A0A841FT79_9ACTN|nr:flavoprotein [Phytomonospora endophytica]MBB6036948.1 phosphopantothenoylcysteine synthetase/decarboxylase [Phytomonospora endophytica]GIG68021.1 flavoprotein [Phytomonospora endophytica]
MPRILHLISCASPPISDLATGIDSFAAAGWDTCVILTPTAAAWLGDDGVDALAARTGRPVRVRLRKPGELDPFPPADAVVAAPLTFNTLNRWAAGISDTTALGNLNRALGLGVPVVAAPVIGPVLRAHPAYAASTTALEGAGVAMLDPDVVTLVREDKTKALAWLVITERLGS